jgi:hypothetical protein
MNELTWREIVLCLTDLETETGSNQMGTSADLATIANGK